MDRQTLRFSLVFALALLLVPAIYGADSGKLDKGYLQAIWDGWASGNVAGQAKYYAQAPDHLFFDVAPLKYNNWQEYQAGATQVLKQFSSMKCSLNDDLQIHPMGKQAWVAGTVNTEATNQKGEKQSLVFRWTAILENQGGRWIIQHEQVSVPMQGM
jgi:ketosteroid isomerase-like protein